MAENENGQEKTEEPSAKRLEDSRKKGQVARSRELNTMAVTLVGAISLVMMSDQMGKGLFDLMSGSFNLSRTDVYDPNAMLTHLSESITQALFMLIPFFIIVVVTALLASVALGGINFSAQAMSPKLSKLNPFKGMKRIFSLKGLLELVKALAKFTMIGSVTALLLWSMKGDLRALSGMSLHDAINQMSEIISSSLIFLASTLILIAVIDVPFQLWDHKRQLRMTRQELREEMKDTDGRPEVKGRIRSMQREIAQRRMMQDVPTADVIVTNPTHYAIAIKYDQSRMHAPRVVAKGKELVAANIRRVGTESKVPIVESPLLARALYFSTEINDYVPAGLYMGVAKLLAYVFQLRVYRTDGGERPIAPKDISVPSEFRTD